MKHYFSIILLTLSLISCKSQSNIPAAADKTSRAGGSIIPAAERIDVYLPLLKGKRLGIFANQTSTVGNTHLVDTLRKSGVDIKVIFGPEHGFRGTADAGEKIGNYTDEKTGIPVVSLYGSKRRPSAEDVKDVDILLFDIQETYTHGGQRPATLRGCGCRQ